MLYLSSFYVFRIDGDCVVKITDNALSRDLFPSDYNCLGDNENRPVKWLALESIVERRFSFASDVVCIEIYLFIHWCVDVYYRNSFVNAIFQKIKYMFKTIGHDFYFNKYLSQLDL